MLEKSATKIFDVVIIQANCTTYVTIKNIIVLCDKEFRTYPISAITFWYFIRSYAWEEKYLISAYPDFVSIRASLLESLELSHGFIWTQCQSEKEFIYIASQVFNLKIPTALQYRYLCITWSSYTNKNQRPPWRIQAYCMSFFHFSSSSCTCCKRLRVL